MKKLIVLFMFAVFAFSLAACTSADRQTEPTQSGQPSVPVTPSRVPESDGLPENQRNILVAYYSATGSTERVAGYIADTLGADTFEIVPEQPYSSDDLNWTEPSSRVNAEHDDVTQRDIALVATTPDNWNEYDVVFVGYPIWWGIAAWPVDNFVKGNDFAGKTVIPFCTSSSSGLGQSGEQLAEMANGGNWQTGQRFQSSVDAADVTEWVNGLGLSATPEP